ncbi:flavodoxin family protein [Maridesulfovibrio sp.]
MIKDDIPAILEQMVASDAVVFASPLYFWGPSAQLKTVIDRTYSLYVD